MYSNQYIDWRMSVFLHRNVAPHRMRFGENIKLMDFLSSLLAFAQRRAKRLGPGQLAADESKCRLTTHDEKNVRVTEQVRLICTMRFYRLKKFVTNGRIKCIQLWHMCTRKIVSAAQQTIHAARLAHTTHSERARAPAGTLAETTTAAHAFYSYIYIMFRAICERFSIIVIRWFLYVYACAWWPQPRAAVLGPRRDDFRHEI